MAPKFEELNALFSSMGLRFTTRLIANKEFNGKVLEPILLAGGGISDTSELFLRSYQMYNMCAGKTKEKTVTTRVVTRNIKEEKDVESMLTDETLKELKIGQLVQTTMRELFRNEKKFLPVGISIN